MKPPYLTIFSLMEAPAGGRCPFSRGKGNKDPDGPIVWNEVMAGHPLDVFRGDLPDGGKVIINRPPTKSDLMLRQEHSLEEEGILAIDKRRLQLIFHLFQFSLLHGLSLAAVRFPDSGLFPPPPPLSPEGDLAEI